VVKVTKSFEQGQELAGEVLRQQQIHLVQRIPMMSQVSAFNGLIVAAVYWNEGSNIVVGIWYAVLLAASALQLAGWKRLSGRDIPKRVSGRMLKRAKYWSAMIGLIWGSSVILFYPQHSEPLQFLLAVLIAGMSAGTVAFLNPIPKLNLWFLITLLTPLVLRFGSELDKEHIAVAVLGVMFGITLMQGSFKGHANLVELVRSNMGMDKARSDLEDAIESTNEAFALFDKDKRLVTANSRFRTWFAGSKKVRGGDSKGRMRKLDDGRWVVSTVRPTSNGGFVSVHVDVSDLKEREDELLAAKLKAESADRAKTQFLANMSHELRTPLNAIIGFSQIMRDQVFGAVGDARYRAYVDDIYGSGQHLLSIINDILDLSKIETSSYELDFEEVELDEIVTWAVSVCRGRESANAARTVEIEIDDDARWLDGDRRALKQILVNLLSNAMKFSEADMPVGVRLRRQADGAVLLHVWDRGIGIARDKLEDVRKPFFQAENTFVKRHAGAGLGLAIVDSLVRGHDGELTIDSEEGVGTVMTVRFPPERVCDRSASPARLAAS